MKTPKIYYCALAVFCVVTLLIGMTNAANVAQSASNRTSLGGSWHKNPPTPEVIIAHLEQQGVDVTEVKTALQNGDTAAVKAWLINYFESHKSEMTNRTRQWDPRMIITRIEQKGVDVSEVKTALQNGDLAAVKAWLINYFESHRGEMVDNVRQNRLLTFIARLEQKGVDVSELKTALQNGDTVAVKAWLDAYREAHKGEMPVRHQCRWS